MKLISEHIDYPVELITESTEGGEKKYFIEGIFMQAEAKNRNGCIYPKKVLEMAVEKYNESQVKTGRAVGELDHPEGPVINLDKVSHRILNLEWQGNDVVGKALVLDTPCGEILKGLLKGGVQLGVSSRGMGSLNRSEGVDYVSDDFFLNTVDVVQDPSAHSAFVNGIMEGVEYIWENGIVVPKQIEEYETEIKNTPKSRLRDTEMDIFSDFLSKMNKR